MKRGVLESWIREFCSLVLIQSIQAFIFTIIIALIVAVGSAENGNQDSKNLAFGVVAIVGLASISKMEELTKKIFGIDPSMTNPYMRGGAKSFMTMMAAGGVAKRVLDNPKKMAAGVKGHFTANKEKMKAMEARNKAMGKLNKRVERDFGSPIASSGLEQMSQNAGEQEAVRNGGSANNLNQTDISQSTKGKNTVSSSNTDISPSAKGENTAGENTAAASNIGSPTGYSNKSISDRTKLHDKYEDQADDIEKNYQDKIDEIKKKQRENWKTSASGVTETIGALMGGTAGIMKGMAEGDIKGMIEGAGFGIGIGDKIGSKAAGAPFAVADAIKEVSKNNAIVYKNQKKKSDAEFARQKKMIDDALKSIKTDVGNVE